MATTFGTRPEDTVADSRGNVLSGVVIELYPTEADANARTSLVSSLTSDTVGLWAYSDTSSRSLLWARDPSGRVWPISSEEAIGSIADKLDVGVAASTYPSKKNPSGAYQLAPTTMWSRLDDAGATIGGDGTVGGALEVYTQISATGHDLAMIVHGHADIHFSRAAPSSRCQTLTITGSPTGGTFTLTYGGQTTTPLAYNVSAASVVAALEALSSVSGKVYVYSGTGGAPVNGGPFTITMAMPDPTALTANGAGLTGGSSPAVVITQTTPDGQAYFDIPIGGNIQITGQLVGTRSTGQLEMRLAQSGGSYRFLSSASSLLMSLNNSGLFTLGTFSVTGNSDLPRFYGGGSSGGIAYYSTAPGAGTGTNGLLRFRDNDTDNNTRAQINTAAPTSGNTVLAVAYHNGAAITFQTVTVGAADSGGAGFKVLRVPN